MASEGDIILDDLQRQRRPWSATGAAGLQTLRDRTGSGDSDTVPECVVTAVCPGWVRTRMGGAGAPTDVQTGSATQVWLATSDEPAALHSGRYMRHMRELPTPATATDRSIQDGLLENCARSSGAELSNP